MDLRTIYGELDGIALRQYYVIDTMRKNYRWIRNSVHD